MPASSALQLDRRGAELLFEVLTEREERSAVAIASNEPFSASTKTFNDPHRHRHRGNPAGATTSRQ
jgi:IstB-like ATP binding protein